MSVHGIKSMQGNMEPLIKGWVWNIPFYPVVNGNTRILKDIFWYDSSQEDAFVNRTDAYEILIPESMIVAPEYAKKFIHDNKQKFIASKEYVVVTDHRGQWSIRSNLLPVRLRLGE